MAIKLTAHEPIASSFRVASRPRAIVAHSFWGRGGAETAAIWIIAALLREFDVTVYTRGGFDVAELAGLAGAPVASHDCRIVCAKEANALRSGRLAHAMFVRSLKRVGADFDLRVTASGVLHWGLPALHFISSAIWHPKLADRFGAAHFQDADTVARRALASAAAWLAQEGERPLNKDVFVANSAWTAEQSAPFCPGRIEVVYPAVAAPGAVSDWSKREEGVLVFGRISPEKRIETCVELVELVRKMGRPLRMCIAGPDGEASYVAKIDALCQARRAWLERLPLIRGADKSALLSRFRYGLSACDIEAFGISSAEMAASGMIVFAPNSGAQLEILGDKRQIYATLNEGAAKLAAVLDDPALQAELRAAAPKAAARFKPERFIGATRALARCVAGIAENSGVAA